MRVVRKYRDVVEVVEVTFDKVSQVAFMAVEVQEAIRLGTLKGDVLIGDGDDPLTLVWECQDRETTHELVKLMRDIAVRRSIPATFEIVSLYLLPVKGDSNAQ